jgi:hypothetical protein
VPRRMMAVRSPWPAAKTPAAMTMSSTTAVALVGRTQVNLVREFDSARQESIVGAARLRARACRTIVASGRKLGRASEEY